MLEWVPALCSLKEKILLRNYSTTCKCFFLSCCNLASAVTAQWSAWTIFVPFCSSVFLSEDLFWIHRKNMKIMVFPPNLPFHIQLLGQSPSTWRSQRGQKKWAELHINIWMIWSDKKCSLAPRSLLGGAVTLRIDTFWHTEIEQGSLVFGMLAFTCLLCYSFISSVKKYKLGKITFSKALINQIHKSNS